MTKQTYSERLESSLNRGGIRTRWVKVLGRTAHVYTFKKYENALLDVMTAAGWSVHSVMDGPSMNGIDGFRMIFQLKD